MLIVLNICIIVLLLVMIAVWSSYGFFSAFINLVVVIVAGVLALAMWEPVSYMLLGRMPAYAHGVGLLGPFVLLVIVLRVAFDKLCKANVHMPRIADQIGGGACGFFSGVLAFGLLLNGVNFLPMHREVMGWEPYKVRGNEVTENPEGQLWSFTRINDWSAGFFSSISTGAMSPTGGTPLAVARPDLAKRAVLTRLPADENQLRTAHPGSVEVTGVYALPANPDAVKALTQRSALLAFLKDSYQVPDDIDYGEDGTGLVKALLKELDGRFVAPQANGKPSDMIDVEAITEVARAFKFKSPATRENFPRFVQAIADKMGEDLAGRLEAVMGKGKTLYVVDTFWNNKHPGAFNSDGKLRVAVPQVSLHVGETALAPIGYSIEYSQNTGGRTFTEIISEDADVALRDAAYSKYTELHMGWVFSLSTGQVPDRFFVRELRFDLSRLDKPQGQDSIVNQNIGAVARVLGAPPLPTESEDALEAQQSSGNPLAQGVNIIGTGAYAEVSELLPITFAAAATSMELDKEADPWTLKSGSSKNLASGKGGQASSIRELWVQPSDRLVRIKLDAQKAKSLYGRMLGVAESLNVMRVQDEGGNFYDAIGFALLKSDRAMQLDIRDRAINRGLSANELPDVRAGETLMVYFQVPIGTNLTAYALGSNEQLFEKPLLVAGRGK